MHFPLHLHPLSYWTSSSIDAIGFRRENRISGKYTRQHTVVNREVLWGVQKNWKKMLAQCQSKGIGFIPGQSVGPISLYCVWQFETEELCGRKLWKTRFDMDITQNSFGGRTVKRFAQCLELRKCCYLVTRLLWKNRTCHNNISQIQFSMACILYYHQVVNFLKIYDSLSRIKQTLKWIASLTILSKLWSYTVAPLFAAKLPRDSH